MSAVGTLPCKENARFSGNAQIWFEIDLPSVTTFIVLLIVSDIPFNRIGSFTFKVIEYQLKDRVIHDVFFPSRIFQIPVQNAGVIKAAVTDDV